MGASSTGRATGFGPAGLGFESLAPSHKKGVVHEQQTDTANFKRRAVI